MLLQFNVKNYMSIKDEIVLSLNANAAKEHEDNLICYDDERILPSIAIYGANAAGKSNIFKALTTAILFVRNSNSMQINSLTGLIPFMLDDESRNKPTKLDFLFTYNGTKYSYGFTGDQYNIYEEYLYEYKSSRPTVIFERENINNYKYTVAYASLKQYEEKNTNNKLFLCTATAWNCQATRNAFMWFAENIDTYTAINIQIGNTYFDELDKRKDNPKFKKLLLEMLKHADINISDYDFESRKIQDLSKIMLPPGIALNAEMVNEIVNNAKEYKLETHHSIETKEGVKDYTLNFDVESAGTKLVFAYAPIILDALEKGRTIVIDEIDSCLHPMLLAYLVSIFNDRNQNKNGAQLIFNTHDTSLLDLSRFRRDQIYFVEKNNLNGVTDLYSLADFSPRKTDDIRKGYMQGRYGAIPVIVGGLEWTND